jgi:hypothetical protein
MPARLPAWRAEARSTLVSLTFGSGYFFGSNRKAAELMQ